MASAIDIEVPVFGNPTTESVRENFAAAKTEIEELQQLVATVDATMAVLQQLVAAAQETIAAALLRTGGTMTGPLLLAGAPAQPVEAATKQYVDDGLGAVVSEVATDASLRGDGRPATPLGIVPASAPQIVTGTDNINAVTSLRLREVIGADVATLQTAAKTVVAAINELNEKTGALTGTLQLVGTYNVAEDMVTPFANSPAWAGALPAASPDTEGWYLIVDTAGTGTGNAPAVSFGVGDWLVSSDTLWQHIAMNLGSVSAASVSLAAIAGFPPTNVQAAIVELVQRNALFLPLTGGGLSGDLAVNGAIVTTGPTNTLLFDDRSITGERWGWYAIGGTAHLTNNMAGIRLSIDRAGTVMVPGGVLELSGLRLWNDGAGRLTASGYRATDVVVDGSLWLAGHQIFANEGWIYVAGGYAAGQLRADSTLTVGGIQLYNDGAGRLYSTAPLRAWELLADGNISAGSNVTVGGTLSVGGVQVWNDGLGRLYSTTLRGVNLLADSGVNVGGLWLNNTSGYLSIGGGGLIVAGSVNSTGPDASLSFTDRSSGHAWAWVSHGDTARLNAGGVGDVFYIGAGGNLGATSLQLEGGGDAVLTVPHGGIYVAGAVTASGALRGGPGGAGNLQSYGTGDIFAFRWDQRPYIRVNEVWERMIVTSNTDNIEAINYSRSGPTGWQIGFTLASGVVITTYADEATSDARLKQNVEDYTTGLDAICALRPVSFEWNGLAGLEPGRRHIGLIADEAKDIMPEMIGSQPVRLRDDDADDTDILTLNDRPLTYALVNALREVRARLAKLEARP